MQHGIRLISQYYDSTSGEIIESIIFHDEELKKAETLNQLGHTHVQQIDLLQKIQEFKIKHQIVLNAVKHHSEASLILTFRLFSCYGKCVRQNKGTIGLCNMGLDSFHSIMIAQVEK